MPNFRLDFRESYVHSVHWVVHLELSPSEVERSVLLLLSSITFSPTPWGRLCFLSASCFSFGFCRSLSTHSSFDSSVFLLLDSMTCRHFLSIHRCSESLRRWLDVFWFGFFRFSSSSDVIQIFLNRLSVSTVDFSDHFTACEFISSYHCFLSASRLSRICGISSCYTMWKFRWSRL